ncbi:hypothetical protein MJO29_012219 [Puccinia striiformis f. sp. tritici]|nr:hypothetical protein MJO29_012219 [Puccinia striiformis f. sp. tritici]
MDLSSSAGTLGNWVVPDVDKTKTIIPNRCKTFVFNLSSSQNDQKYFLLRSRQSFDALCIQPNQEPQFLLPLISPLTIEGGELLEATEGRLIKMICETVSSSEGQLNIPVASRWALSPALENQFQLMFSSLQIPHLDLDRLHNTFSAGPQRPGIVTSKILKLP